MSFYGSPVSTKRTVRDIQTDGRSETLNVAFYGGDISSMWHWLTVVGSPFIIWRLFEELGQIRPKSFRALAVWRHQSQQAPAQLTTVAEHTHMQKYILYGRVYHQIQSSTFIIIIIILLPVELHHQDWVVLMLRQCYFRSNGLDCAVFYVPSNTV